MTWLIRKATDGDKKSIISFFTPALWKSRGEELYKWKYEDNPGGEALKWLAVDSGKDNKIAGVVIMMPWRFKIGSYIYNGTQIVDALTDTQYRGQGIYTAIDKQSVMELGEMGHPFSFAFPNEGAISGHRKAGWNELGFSCRWVKPLKASYILTKIVGDHLISRLVGNLIDIGWKLISKKKFYKPSSRYSIKEIKKFDPRFDALWETASGNFQIIAVRDSGYLNWKYLNTPHQKRVIFSIEKEGELGGYVVLEMGEKFGYVVDIFTLPDPELINQLVAHTIRYSRARDALSVTLVAFENNFYAPYFKKFGFHLRPEKSPVMVHVNSDKIDKNFLLDSQNWFLTIGDCDIENVT